MPRDPRSGGFALVVTVSLLVLLSLVAIGLLSLSAISLRSVARESDLATARANARLSLQLAIGELQKFAGPDTRITAPADLFNDTNPAVIGVWRSWEGADHERRGRFQGRPIRPDYGSKQSSAADGGRFLTWLVSNPSDRPKPDVIPSELVRDQSAAGFLPLLSSGSLPDDGLREIHVKPIEVGGDQAGRGGALAWWVSGENQKARIPAPYEPGEDTAAQWSALAKSHAVPDPKPFELESLLKDSSEVEKTITRRSASFLSEAGSTRPADRLFHDLSANAVGLLTNSATGGWRKDLSLLTENWDQLPRSDLPFFRLTPETTISSTRPTPGNHLPEASMLYPWANYRDGAGQPPIYQHGAVSSWHNLMDYATTYRRIVSSGSNGNSIPFTARDIINPGGAHDFLHRVRSIPVIARIHWVFSHQTTLRGSRPTGRGTHRLQLLMTPVVTMWNPFNVSIDSDPLRLSVNRPLPCAFRYNSSRGGFSALTTAGSHPSLSGRRDVHYEIAERFKLGPGETRIFSPGDITPVLLDAQPTLRLEAGYRPGSGHLFDVKDANGAPMVLNSSESIRVDVNFDTSYSDGAQGTGIYVDMRSLASNDWLLAYRMVYPVSIARKYWKPIANRELASPTAAEVANNPMPFLSTVFGSRVASDSHLPGKGFVQTNPLVNYTAMGKTRQYGNIAHAYTGADHPVNAPFDYSFLKHAPGGDSRLPNASEASNRGYIISGFDKSDGLSRIVISELPLRPLASLGELQNWDMRYENPVPPYQFNIIGNSDASPLLPPDAVVNSSDDHLPANLQHDDSYCANHLLFDDWFFSSIAPDPASFGPRGTDMRTRFTEFLSGDNPLPNRSYRPIPEDRNLTSRDAASLFRNNLMSKDGWQRIASRLEVEGMFNVNSTSVAAWHAFLGHARELKVPYLSEAGDTWPIELSEETDYAFSRFTVAGDVEAGKPGTGGAFPGSSEFTGYRVLEEEALDLLAEEVVAQVRARGPFLSLSEFVNRQLSSGELALAGAIQTALNRLAERPGSAYQVLQELSSAAGVAINGELDNADYKFPDAALGKSSFGLPGWTRQADILRPLAPVLSVRDDTFTIRAAGEARDANGAVLARATCEAVVRRSREFIDPAEEADRTTAPQLPANVAFGRRFEMISFRWLASDEV